MAEDDEDDDLIFDVSIIDYIKAPGAQPADTPIPSMIPDVSIASIHSVIFNNLISFCLWPKL